jgi:glucosamine-6-phosphate deaminase
VEVIAVRDQAELAAVGADLVTGWLAERPTPTLLAALGDSPLGIYAELADRRRDGRFDTGRLRVVQLDAYLGIGRGDRRSLGGWLDRVVVEPLGVAEERVIRLPGDAPDPTTVARTWDAAVAAAGGIDVAVLGLGPNGHLGFNEPPSGPTAPTRVVDLTEASLESNGRYWGSSQDVPRRAITGGMPALLLARHPLLVVSGAHKRAVLRRVLDGPAGDDVPASYLRDVPATVVLADHAALGR